MLFNEAPKGIMWKSNLGYSIQRFKYKILGSGDQAACKQVDPYYNAYYHGKKIFSDGISLNEAKIECEKYDSKIHSI